MISIGNIVSSIKNYLNDIKLVAVPMHSLEDKLGMPLIRRGQGRNTDYYPNYMIEELKREHSSNE